ncbi:MAG: efflux RND transporter periplasmic adaptor subunit [Ginsengibacter sp.]
MSKVLNDQSAKNTQFTMGITITRISFIFLFFSCNNKVEKTKPVSENITESVYASAIIKSKDQYQTFATVTGIINKIFVTENDLVKKGDPLMQVMDKSSTVNRENASLAAGYADVNTNREKLTDAKNSIALAQSKCSNDSLLYQRQKKLWNENIGTKMEVEQRELAYKNSKTTLESAKIRYNDLLKELEFNAKQAKNNLSISQYRESDFVIKSEMNGKVYSLIKEQGEMVTPQTPLAIIGDATVFLLEMQIDEYDIAKIKLGQIVMLTMDSYKGEVFEAKVSKIIPLMNERSKSFTVEAEFVKQPPVLYPNLTAEANIIIQSKENALTIPRSYLINDSMVLVEKDKKRKVVTGLKDYQKVEIIKGLTSSDIIFKPQ